MGGALPKSASSRRHPGARKKYGAVAQLGERCDGIAEVRGSIPLGSTIPLFQHKRRLPWWRSSSGNGSKATSLRLTPNMANS